MLLLNFSTQDDDVVHQQTHNLQVGILPGISKKKFGLFTILQEGIIFSLLLSKRKDRDGDKSSNNKIFIITITLGRRAGWRRSNKIFAEDHFLFSFL